MISLQANCASSIDDDGLRNIQGQGIEYLAVNFLPADATASGVVAFQQRAARFGLRVADAGCPPLQKCPQIHLAQPDRDEWIAKYNEFTRVLGGAGIPVNYVAWQPNGIYRSRIGIGAHTRGQNAMICDLEELRSRPIANDRAYTDEEIWKSFEYFAERALPVCEEAGVKLALHPNDPPVEEVCGVPSLIWNSDCYRRVFDLVGDSPYLGIKMCFGCWLEGGADFGDIHADIHEFVRRGKVLVVHFRNVSSPLPVFEETLLEDGYADMPALLDELIAAGYDGQINIDHPFFTHDGAGMSPLSDAYYNGYLKGLLHAAYRSAGVPQRGAANTGVPQRGAANTAAPQRGAANKEVDA
jgi:mannonate dehydratase